MTTFFLYYAVTVDPETKTGVWAYRIEEDGAKVWEQDRFKLEETTVGQLEVEAVSDALKNLCRLNYKFRVLIQHDRDQAKVLKGLLADPLRTEIEKVDPEHLIDFLSCSRKSKIYFNRVRKSKVRDSLRSLAQSKLKSELSTIHW